MPASSVAVFGVPRAFESALQRGCNVELLIAGHGEFRAELISIVLPRLRLLRGREALARVAMVSVAASSHLVILPLESEQPQTCDGALLATDEIMTVAGGETLRLWTGGPCTWGVISISTQELLSYGQAVVGQSFRLAPGVCRLRPSRGSLQSLMVLFSAAIRLTAARPATAIRTVSAARGLEQEAIGSLIDCVSTAYLRHLGTRPAN